MIDACPICHQLHATLACPTHPTALLQLEADAGAVRGCDKACETMREENKRLTLQLAGLRAVCDEASEQARLAGFTVTERWTAADVALRLREALVSLRADAEAVRAENERLRAALAEINDPVQAMRERLPEGKTLNGAIAATLADNAGYLRGVAARALMARRQEEGQTDNG